MSTNRIQFQPGLPLAEFFRRFGTRAVCVQPSHLDGLTA